MNSEREQRYQCDWESAGITDRIDLELKTLNLDEADNLEPLHPGITDSGES